MRLFTCLTVVAVLFAPLAIAVEKIVVLGLFKDKAIVKIDGKQHVLSAGQTSPEGVRLISANSEQAVLEINGTSSTYKLGTHIGSQFAQPSAGRSVQIWPDSHGMYATVGSINGYPVDFLVDTGATLIALNRNQAKRLGIDYLVDGIKGTSSTASGVVTTYYVQLKKVRVGEIELRSVDAAVVDGDFPREVLLGNSFLNRLNMRRDGRMLELRKKP